ncbi:MAG TPA: HRDC domain-containing protein [Propionibacteriaceae bacterium]|nr:HRDC domain-containing protein [Propionibacteriaceae bacterium]
MTEVPLATTASDAEPALLTSPPDGVPPVVSTDAELAATMAALQAGSGPVAVDAERAHGFRYSQRAYLIQLRRAGSGTHMIDPVAFGSTTDGGPLADLSTLVPAIGDAEWVIHAASQDLSCLYEIGLVPETLFDTELAARLLGFPRVALGTMLEELLGVRLLKEHSAADWSTRPLPAEWLTYAALDVELLLELRDILHTRLVEAGKAEWARQEFAALVATAGVQPEPRPDPWRRTSGIHRVRTRRGLGYVAALWYARDAIAARLDRAPGKVLADVAISELAAHPAPGRAGMRQIPGFARRQARRFEADWLAAIEEVSRMRESELPPMHVFSEGPPQARLWPAKDPIAAARLAAVRVALLAIADDHGIPVENLLTPEHVRRLAWRPPSPLTEETVDATLAGYGARCWQRELTVSAVTPLLVTRE